MVPVGESDKIKERVWCKACKVQGLTGCERQGALVRMLVWALASSVWGTKIQGPRTKSQGTYIQVPTYTPI